jgi:hypothetical protein
LFLFGLRPELRISSCCRGLTRKTGSRAQGVEQPLRQQQRHNVYLLVFSSLLEIGFDAQEVHFALTRWLLFFAFAGVSRTFVRTRSTTIQA